MSAININQNNFLSEVIHSEKPVLLDFWAPWCGPCRMAGPVLEEIAEERSGLKVGKVNVDEQPELARQFGIMNIPTLIVMRGRECVNLPGRPANKQGRIIADNICGGDSRYPGSQGSSVIKVFDMTAAATGINETHAKRGGLNGHKVILSP